MSATISIFEAKAVDDLAISLLDPNVDSKRIYKDLIDVAALLDCSVGGLVATYLRDSLSAVNHTPRVPGELDGETVIDLGYMSKHLHSVRSESLPVRVAHPA